MLTLITYLCYTPTNNTYTPYPKVYLKTSTLLYLRTPTLLYLHPPPATLYLHPYKGYTPCYTIPTPLHGLNPPLHYTYTPTRATPPATLYLHPYTGYTLRAALM